jgi:hypothetical protein
MIFNKEHKEYRVILIWSNTDEFQCSECKKHYVSDKKDEWHSTYHLENMRYIHGRGLICNNCLYEENK